MENTTLAAWIVGGCTIVAGGVGVAVGWFKKPKGGQMVVQTGDVSGSVVAVGDNNTQITGTINNYHAPAPVRTGPFDGKVATRPSIEEILDAVRSNKKPYERVFLPDNYVGLSVSWQVLFSSLHRRSDDSWSAHFCPPGDRLCRSVSTDLDIEKYPKFKVIESGHPAWIEGKIRRVDLSGIDLEDGAVITLE
jgi:hypothetical protein